jgi:hypothetical protein
MTTNKKHYTLSLPPLPALLTALKYRGLYSAEMLDD